MSVDVTILQHDLHVSKQLPPQYRNYNTLLYKSSLNNYRSTHTYTRIYVQIISWAHVLLGLQRIVGARYQEAKWPRFQSDLS
jgi:hypothetical protein